MSIQFRCVHCRQLLGISSSRAGTQVDCPACGRTLRVPAETGGHSAPLRTVSPQIDAGLLGALEELASLTGPGRSQRPGNRKAAPEASPLTPPVARKRENLRIVPIKTEQGQSRGNEAEQSLFESPERVFEQLANLPPVVHNDSPSILNDDHATSDSDEDFPDEESTSSSSHSSQPQTRNLGSAISPEHTDALAELAASVPSEGSSVVSKNDWSRSSSDDHPTRRSWSWVKFAGLLVAVVLSFVGGLATGIYKRPGSQVVASADKAEPSEQTVLKQAIEPTGPANPDPEAVELITGRITFLDNNGAEKPDSNALVLLLPSKKETDLKLDAGPLRDLTSTPGRTAIEAALATLGASVIRSDEAGEFKIPRRTSGAATLVVISRHLAAKDADAGNRDALTSMSTWLENPSAVIGRLACQIRPLSEVANGTIVPPIAIQFDPKK